MLGCPFNDQAQRTWWQFTGQQAKPSYVDFSLLVTITNMKMWWIVFLVVHRHNYSKESADFRPGKLFVVRI